jgi:hypothetical protein
MAGRVDDDLLPHRSPEAVLQVVDFVEDHETDVVDRRRVGVDHVAQHLGRHHDDLGAAVDDVVAGEQPDPVGAVRADQIAELLVGERLDRRRVEHPGPALAARWMAASATRVLPAPVGADTTTLAPEAIASLAST